MLYSYHGMTISEPVTMLTDYLLTIACGTYALLTLRSRGAHRAIDLWILSFTCGAVAAFLGGTFHGFRDSLSPTAGKSLWETTMIFIGATSAFLIAATIVSSLRDKTMPHVRWLKRGLTLSVAGFAFQGIGWAPSPAFTHNDVFHVVQIVGYWCLYQGAKRLK